MLVVFDPDIIITTEVLATLWGLEPYEAEDTMMSKRGRRGGDKRREEEREIISLLYRYCWLVISTESSQHKIS